MSTTEPAGWNRPIQHWTNDAFAGRTTIHGLPSDEVRSALHKHMRRGRRDEAIKAAVELVRTDAEHEAEMWLRLQVLAAIAVVRACHEAADDTAPGSYDRMVFAAHAAGYLAGAPKDPTLGEIMQVVLHRDLTPDIPDEALCVHTRRGQEMGRTMEDWFRDGTVITPEVEGRDRSWNGELRDLYREVDPSQVPEG